MATTMSTAAMAMATLGHPQPQRWPTGANLSDVSTLDSRHRLIARISRRCARPPAKRNRRLSLRETGSPPNRDGSVLRSPRLVPLCWVIQASASYSLLVRFYVLIFLPSNWQPLFYADRARTVCPSSLNRRTAAKRRATTDPRDVQTVDTCRGTFGGAIFVGTSTWKLERRLLASSVESSL
ncbi:hypothetical protein G7046_g5155 [Stylonectria norvegica]|nr:hypothetical protein G7046_g5155 [Stylonectria norvegica]